MSHPSPPMATCASEEGEPRLRRALGRTAAVALVLGSVIGSGIFFKPREVALQVGAFGWVAAVWLAAGLVCLLGALSVAELAAMLPRAGGLYVYLREAYGRLVAFLYGWSLFIVVRPAATGALGSAFAADLPIAAAGRFAVSVGVILALAWVNVMGVAWGGRTQVATALIKAGFVLAVAVVPWGLGAVDPGNFAAAAPGEGVSVSTFMVALLAVLFAYNSWHEVTPLAEEIREPRRNVPLALVAGVGIITVLYVGANVAYHGVLGGEGVASTRNAAAALMYRALGSVGGAVMTVLVMCSVLGTINANLLHAPRVYFAMGRDHVFFPRLARLHRTRGTPVLAIASQAVLAILLVTLVTAFADRGVFDLLTDVVVFGASVFYTLAVLAVFVLRRRRPDLERPYRTLGYPVTPALFVLAYACFLPIVFAQRPVESCLGLGAIALGAPVYLAFRRRLGEDGAVR